MPNDPQDEVDPTTEELRITQAKQEHGERRTAREAELDDQAEKHDRRADKAAYLREKLEQRADAERRAGRD